MANFLTKQEREKLREEISEQAGICGVSGKRVLALLDHIDALEEQKDEQGFKTIPVGAAWLLDTKPEGFIDWGCKQCVPEDYMGSGDFVCYYHRAEAAIASAQETK